MTFVQRAGELRLVAAALGRGGQTHHRRREDDPRHGQLADRAARLQLFDFGHGHDVAGDRLVDRLHLVGLHAVELADLDSLALADHR